MCPRVRSRQVNSVRIINPMIEDTTDEDEVFKPLSSCTECVLNDRGAGQMLLLC